MKNKHRKEDEEMAYQATFKRYEYKYLLTHQKKEAVLQAMRSYMRLDEYGRATIRNIYFDTDTYRLIRRSLEKPAYKEKLRIRSYQTAAPEDPVFVELKKKYKSVVYKRRLTLTEAQAMDSFLYNQPLPVRSQIADEIEYFRSYYGDLRPAVFLTYEREAFYALDGGDFRVTFDENILYREEDISLESPAYGIPLLEEGQTLMELKTSGGMPLWMSHTLNGLRLYRTSFSKYGSAYRDMMEHPGAREQRRLQYAC